MAKITYVDKAALNLNPDIPDTNKCNASDMNEIKRVVNENANINEYLTTEQVIGKWIDDKPIYRKVINFGSLPNATTKSVAHNISNIDFITNINIVSKNPTYNFYISVPYTNKSDVSYQIEFYINNTNIFITTGDNKSGYNETYVILEYTKTTD